MVKGAHAFQGYAADSAGVHLAAAHPFRSATAAELESEIPEGSRVAAAVGVAQSPTSVLAPSATPTANTFLRFTQFPREIQDHIWEHSAVPPSPCVQAIGLHLVSDSLWNHSLAFNLPAQDLLRYSQYYHTAAEARLACLAAAKGIDWAISRWDQEEAAELAELSNNIGIPPGAVNELRTMAIIALPKSHHTTDEGGQETENDRQATQEDGNTSPSDGVPQKTAIHTVELGLQSPPRFDYDHLSITDLAPVQQLAIEFNPSIFSKECTFCDHLVNNRESFMMWCRSQTGEDDHRGFELCVLCTALEDESLSDLNDDQKWEAREWLKLDHTRQLIYQHRGYVKDLAALRKLSADIEAELGDPFDFDAFLKVLPLLRRVNEVMAVVEAGMPEEGDEQESGIYSGRIPACLYDFDWDRLAFLKNSQSLLYWVGRNNPDPGDYDFETGDPICLAGRPVPKDKYQPTAQYIVDRRIKLRPAAPIPEGTRTFHGNGFLFVEVSPPANRRLERGGEDEVWKYPQAGPWGKNAFEFARQIRKWMFKRRREVQKDWVRGVMNLNPAQVRGLEDGRVPECKVLTIVE
ncbi:hypothetical protein VTJ49DRAFT_6380 [Mycothermus thermophilus]|uniref:Uncharacterized protein n=1 Tax=Humicola insolens TaxID=85995 RepID=A0ABR3VRL1_HUMIN